MSLNGVISRFKTGLYTITRRTAGTYVDGVYTPDPAPTTVANVAMSIQPVTGRALQSLPEGQRADETRIVFTETALFTRSPSRAPDVITYKGEPWEVISVEEWDHWGDTHYRAMIARRSNP